MRQDVFEIVSNRNLAPNVYEMVLRGSSTGDCTPGRFVQLKMDSFYLRRPISVCDAEEGKLTLVYKTVGRGTEAMAQYESGKRIDVLTGLGNGYDLDKSGDRPLLIGGGAGVPPKYLLTRRLLAQGKQPAVILGFNKAEEIFYADRFRALGIETIIATADGSVGVKGFVTDAMEGLDYTYTYACGPEPMLKAVYNRAATSGEYSFEERMGCGFGACMGCTCETKYGNKRICKDGPVLAKEEIVW